MAVELTPVGLGVSVGQLRTGESFGQEPQRVCRDHEGNVNLTIGIGNMARAGHEADIKRDVHWLLVTRVDGSFELQPVSAWYAFDRSAPDIPVHDEEEEYNDVYLSRKKRRVSLGCMGEEGIKNDVLLRRQLQRRWGGMLERRAVRTGRCVDSAGQSKIRSQIQDDYRYAGAGLAPEVLSMLKTIKGVDAMQCIRELEALEALPWHKRTQLYNELQQHPEQLQEAVAALDSTDGSILSGLHDSRRAEVRKRKARQKRLKARIQPEDVEEVPETANTLKQLKSAQGEGLWDFEDAEEFSDDEQEEEDQNNQLEADWEVPQKVLAPEKIWESDSEEEGGILSKQGEEVEALLKKYKNPDGDDQSEDEEAEPVPEPAPKGKASPNTTDKPKGPKAKAKAKAKTKSDQPKVNGTALQQRTVVPGSPSNPKEGPKPIELKQDRREESAKTEEVEETKKSTKPTNEKCKDAQGTESSKTEKNQTEVTEDELKLKVITLLQKKGGSSYLSVMSSALGLKSLNSSFGQKALAVLREVAEYDTMPGEARVAVLLKVQYWGHVAEGPAAPSELANRRPWCYLDSSGKAVGDRASAQHAVTHGVDFYRARLSANMNASCWLPASKAPSHCNLQVDTATT